MTLPPRSEECFEHMKTCAFFWCKDSFLHFQLQANANFYIVRTDVCTTIRTYQPAVLMLMQNSCLVLNLVEVLSFYPDFSLFRFYRVWLPKKTIH